MRGCRSAGRSARVAGCRRSLDVGCGEGMLARDLRRVVPHVTGIDRDAASIDLARREDSGAGVLSRSPAPSATGFTG